VEEGFQGGAVTPMMCKPSAKTSMIWKHGFESLAKIPGANLD
jgi:hypothetical protein